MRKTARTAILAVKVTVLSKVAVPVLMLVSAGLLAGSAVLHSPAFDEVGHLPAGMVVWQEGRFDLYRVNPPLIRAWAVLPAVFSDVSTDALRFDPAVTERPEWKVGRRLISENGIRSFPLWTAGRWMLIPLNLLGGWLCFLWARELFGEPAGLLALALWCFEPNLLGNSGMITPDLGATTLGLLAAWSFSRWLKRPAALTAVGAGIALGLAQLAKLSWIILFILWPALWVVHRVMMSSKRRSEPQWTRDVEGTGRPALWQLLLILVLGLDVLNLGYLGNGSLTPLGEFPFQSESLSGSPSTGSAPLSADSDNGSTGNRFSGTWLGAIPVPLPWDYVIGLDVQKLDFEQKKWSYLCGEFRHGGWWYYYLVALALKAPLSYWLLGAASLVYSARRWRRGVPSSIHPADLLLLTVPPTVLFLFVSSETGFSRYLRYVLPVFPFALIGISGVARVLTEQAGRMWNVGIAVLVLWGVGSSLWQYPHSLSYMNELAGGPRRGDRYLSDANLSWGQDVFFLRDWIAAHPDARPLTVAYVSFFDLKVAGIEFPMTPAFDPDHRYSRKQQMHLGPQPGWHIVDVRYLRSHRRHFDYFHEFVPVDYIAGSMRVFHLTEEQADSARRRLGTAGSPR